MAQKAPEEVTPEVPPYKSIFRMKASPRLGGSLLFHPAENDHPCPAGLLHRETGVVFV